RLANYDSRPIGRGHLHCPLEDLLHFCARSDEAMESDLHSFRSRPTAERTLDLVPNVVDVQRANQEVAHALFHQLYDPFQRRRIGENKYSAEAWIMLASFTQQLHAIDRALDQNEVRLHVTYQLECLLFSSCRNDDVIVPAQKCAQDIPSL